MELITEQLARELPAIGSTSELTEEQMMVKAMFFSVVSPAKWLIFEYSPEDRIVFCYADLFGDGRMGGAELGYTSVDELESLVFGPFGFPVVVRAEGFTPMPFLECIDSDGRILF